MAKPIRITITGKGAVGSDAPTVSDLLSQIQDFVSILEGVEDAVADNEAREIEWRVTDATKNSPLTLEITPFALDQAKNIDTRLHRVVQVTSDGFCALQQGTERPMFFSDRLINGAERILNRATNGLAETLVDMSIYDGVESIRLTEPVARQAVKNLHELRNPKAQPYRELGSIEGYINKVELDGFDRPIVWLRQRIDKQLVKCIGKGRALDRIGHMQVSEVLKSMRVQVFGLIKYKDYDKVDHINVDDVYIFQDDSELPSYKEIVDPDFTGGVEASEYLRELRRDA